jgi:alpha-L-rhamnosidase
MRTKNIFYLISICLLITIKSVYANNEIKVSNLRCEMLDNPLAINTQYPFLSWKIESSIRNIRQVAYQIIIASSPDNLSKNIGDIWNSGKIESSQSVNIKYSGPPLQSRMNCYWKVKAWTNIEQTQWSEPAYFYTGLISESDWQAKWIGLDKSFEWDSISKFSRLSARYFRKQFKINSKIKSAHIYIVGLGLYELYINGNKIGNQVLSPSPTDYRKSVKYNVFDVKQYLVKSTNAVGVILGNGRFFTMRQNYKPYKINTFGFPKMLLQLEIEYFDGSKQIIVSDETWKVTADGPIRSNNEYDGEEYDANKEMPGWNEVGFNDNKWLKAELVDSPGGRIEAQMNKNMKIMETIKPLRISKLTDNIYIIDMGQNFAGWIKINVKGRKGDVVKMRFAEILNDTGGLYTANLRDAKVTDLYTLKGSGNETWEPSFVYHGFRYVEITGYPGIPSLSDFEGKVVYDEMETIGTFETSKETINQIYKNAYWGIRSNYKGMPVDCPQRNERQPWLGDRTIGSYGESFIFNNFNLYSKWLDDIQQSQTPEGSIPDVAPNFWFYYKDNITWPATYILVANMIYIQTGNYQPIIKHYEYMKKWLNYMYSKYSSNYIITRDSYGDWCVPPESKTIIHTKDSLRITDGKLIATAYFFHLLNLMKKFALLQNKTDDFNDFSILADSVKNAFNKEFLDIKSCKYGNNSVTSNILPLYFNITPDSLKNKVFNNITEKILRENNGHISTGVIGTQWIMRLLTEFGRPDIAYTIVTKRDYPSWGYMIENDATTIWELWNGNTANPAMNSHNHVMLLGDLIIWLYENIAGIKSNSDNPGFKEIIMNPSIIDGIKFVRASYNSVYGLIKSEYHNEIDCFKWNISIPANTKAIIYIPCSDSLSIFESNRPVNEIADIKFLRMQDNKAVFEIGSGDYSFVSYYKWKKGILKSEFIFEHSSFPESHAATIAETKEGIAVAWFGGTKERNPDVCIWLSRYFDNKWTEPVIVADGIVNDTLRYACWNPVLYTMPDGKLLLFYKTGPKVSEWKGWLKISDDNGVTWSEAIQMPDRYLGPVKNKPVLLENGTLICPSSTENNGWKVYFEISDDFGTTWNKIEPFENEKVYQVIQPTILKYKNNVLQILCRSKNRSIIESWSYDGGKTWSGLKPTELPNNNSGIDAVSLSDGRQLLVYNHVLPPEGQNKGERTPLNVAVSDDGKTWYAALILENSKAGQYSYPSVIQTSDGRVHIVYTWQRQRIKHVEIDPSKLDLQKIENGIWP